MQDEEAAALYDFQFGVAIQSLFSNATTGEVNSNSINWLAFSYISDRFRELSMMTTSITPIYQEPMLYQLSPLTMVA